MQVKEKKINKKEKPALCKLVSRHDLMQDNSKKKLTHSTASVFLIERYFFSVLFVSV